MDDWEYDRPRIYFSAVEILHLLLGVVGITVAFALLLGGSKGCPDDQIVCVPQIDARALVRLLPYAAVVVLPAFILHELAHKIVAQRKDMWAEFRANYFGLTGGIVLTAMFKILLSVPGAVFIYGDADRRDAGVIGIVGPLVNLAIGYVALGLDALLPSVDIPSAGATGIGSLYELIVLANAVLAAFNMLPVGPLDGRKVWSWSPVGFFGMWALIVALVLLVLNPRLAF
ncbi:MAG TPA: M50 family metallopeptidase [Candidatus Thermoplasmatota archaeon]|nr:M50 family metallopeptidase [Candidatus Thermoplasmatota archaeon]